VFLAEILVPVLRALHVLEQFDLTCVGLDFILLVVLDIKQRKRLDAGSDFTMPSNQDLSNW
jgi:hypothetical protein